MRSFKFYVTYYERYDRSERLGEVVEASNYDEAEEKVLAMYGDSIDIDEIYVRFESSLNDKHIYIDMPDGFTYAIPAMVVAQKKASKISAKTDALYYDVMVPILDDFESNDQHILDYAKAELNWEDVKGKARRLKKKQDIDYEYFWKNNDLRIK